MTTDERDALLIATAIAVLRLAEERTSYNPPMRKAVNDLIAALFAVGGVTEEELP
jgi:Arc/MetJ family transcription regulator